MPRVAAALLVAALAACGKSACQELGERICQCQPGLSSATCKTQVEQQLKSTDPGDAFCEQLLGSCDGSRAPAGAEFCEWLLTPAGKAACGLTRPPQP